MSKTCIAKVYYALHVNEIVLDQNGLIAKIKAGEIVVPATLAAYEKFK